MPETGDRPRAPSRHEGPPRADGARVDGPFALVERVGEPAILLDRDGRVVAHNTHAAGIADELAQGLIAGMAEQRTTALSRVKIARGGRPGWFDLTAIPFPAEGLTLVLARETTLEHNLREALVDSRARYRDLIEMSSDFVWETDATGAFVFVSPGGALGYAADAMIGRRPQDFLVDPEMGDLPLPFDAPGRVDGSEVWARDAEGRPRCLVTTVRPIEDAAGKRAGTRGVCRDVTAERLREADLALTMVGESVVSHMLARMQEANEPQAVLDAACAAIVPALSAAGGRLYRARADGRLSVAASVGDMPEGHDADTLSTARLDVEDPAGSVQRIGAEARHRRQMNGKIVLWRAPDGEPWSAADRALLVKIADQLGLAIAEIGEREMLERLSTSDPLTELMNRRAFTKQLEARMAETTANQRPGSLIFIDLDNFKQINDSAGHDRGDAALRAVAAMLRRIARATDLVARVGGDEFALWLDDMSRAGAEGWARRALAKGELLHEYDASPALPLGLSIGIAVFQPGSGETPDQLIARADQAMYAGKRQGKGSVVLADPAPGARLRNDA